MSWLKASRLGSALHTVANLPQSMVITCQLQHCLKLFDDRFQPLEDSVNFKRPIPRWFYRVAFAEYFSVNEAFVYDKLRPVQGTVIPWFYGVHQFTLPDGLVLRGLLMEYIDVHDLNSDYIKQSSPEKQIEMIQSCRHAVRVLDIGDVSQHDWHSGQVLIYTNPAANIDHAVLIDFALTTQTWDPQVINLLRSYFHMYGVLLGGSGDVAFDPDLVLDHYGDPDEWDTVNGAVGHRGGRQKRVQYTGNMFPFIHMSYAYIREPRPETTIDVQFG